MELEHLITALAQPDLTEEEGNTLLIQVSGLVENRAKALAKKLLWDGNLVDDVFNVVLFNIWRSASTYSGLGSAMNWVLAILKKECLKFNTPKGISEDLRLESIHREFDDWEANWCKDETNGGWGDGPDYERRIRDRDLGSTEKGSLRKASWRWRKKHPVKGGRSNSEM